MDLITSVFQRFLFNIASGFIVVTFAVGNYMIAQQLFPEIFPEIAWNLQLLVLVFYAVAVIVVGTLIEGMDGAGSQYYRDLPYERRHSKRGRFAYYIFRKATVEEAAIGYFKSAYEVDYGTHGAKGKKTLEWEIPSPWRIAQHFPWMTEEWLKRELTYKQRGDLIREQLDHSLNDAELDELKSAILFQANQGLWINARMVSQLENKKKSDGVYTWYNRSQMVQYMRYAFLLLGPLATTIAVAAGVALYFGYNGTIVWALILNGLIAPTSFALVHHLTSIATHFSQRFTRAVGQSYSALVTVEKLSRDRKGSPAI
ncbi:MAG: hypothetical protein FWD55_02675 [Propionibacteriaceae bacterium]|nr:hypothetical protein [Propionibacteriaceae bacterium]